MGGSWWRSLTECGPLEKAMANHFSILALRTSWTVWKEYWGGLPFPPRGDLPNPGIKPTSLLAGVFFTTSTTWEAHTYHILGFLCNPHNKSINKKFIHSTIIYWVPTMYQVLNVGAICEQKESSCSIMNKKRKSLLSGSLHSGNCYPNFIKEGTGI